MHTSTPPFILRDESAASRDDKPTSVSRPVQYLPCRLRSSFGTNIVARPSRGRSLPSAFLLSRVLTTFTMETRIADGTCVERSPSTNIKWSLRPHNNTSMPEFFPTAKALSILTADTSWASSVVIASSASCEADVTRAQTALRSSSLTREKLVRVKGVLHRDIIIFFVARASPCPSSR